jgi:hypothetical protein
MNVTRLVPKRMQLMREREARAGHVVVVPGEMTWLPLKDWHPDSVISIDGRHVRLIDLYAHQPHSGAFRRLIANILAHGLTPDVIDPWGELENTLTRWGWDRNEFGRGCEVGREEVWRPPGREQGECEKCG